MCLFLLNLNNLYKQKRYMLWSDNMSKLWEDLKDNMREWSNSAVEKA